MLPQHVKEKLLHNWGDKVSAMECFVEIRYFDPISSWCCYIFALNPDNEDDIACIVKEEKYMIVNWTIKELYECYNTDGEPMEIDHEFRRMKAVDLYKKLIGRK